ncbi:hypothetical protein P3T43_002218 [Paraburkholderia sp. GAS41]
MRPLAFGAKTAIALHLHGATLSNLVAGTIRAWAVPDGNVCSMGKYFWSKPKSPHPSRPTQILRAPVTTGIGIPQAVSLWEDAVVFRHPSKEDTP